MAGEATRLKPGHKRSGVYGRYMPPMPSSSLRAARFVARGKELSSLKGGERNADYHMVLMYRELRERDSDKFLKELRGLEAEHEKRKATKLAEWEGKRKLEEREAAKRGEVVGGEAGGEVVREEDMGTKECVELCERLLEEIGREVGESQ